MARNYSATFKRRINATSAPEAPLYLLEISHAALAEPARVVNDAQDFPYGRDFMFVPGKLYAVNDLLVPAEYNGRYYKVTVGGVAGGAEPVWPLVIGNTVASGACTFRCEGNQYRAMAFRGAMPDDKPRQMPRARLEIDNVGRELTQWVEASAGGKDATVRILQVLRSAPAVIEWEITVDMRNMRMNAQVIGAELGFDNTLGKPAVALRFDPQTAPGLF